MEHRFIVNSERGGPEQLRRARIAFGAAGVGFAAGVVMSLRYRALLEEPARSVASTAVLCTSITVLPALEVLRRGHPRTAVHLVLGSLLMAIALNAYYLGGPTASVLYWAAIVPAVSAFAGSARSAMLCWAGCQAMIAGLAALAFTGHVFPQPPSESVAHEVWFSSVCSLTIAMFAFVMIFEWSKEATLRRLKAANRALSVARDRAHRASSSKSEFLARVSHEIRTPLTAILGFSELLTSRLWPDESAAQRAETIRRNARHLLDVINDILDLSKIEAGLLEVGWEDGDPVALVREVVALMEVRAREGEVELRLDVEAQVPRRIRTDPTRLRQVLINLLGNAIKFSPQGRVSIRVSVGAAADEAPRLEFEVADTGIGMSPDQVERLFEPFQQAEASVARRFGGSGLGLSISQKLCRLMGGEIRVQSVSGQGSIFTLDLPIDPTLDLAAGDASSQIRYASAAGDHSVVGAHVRTPATVAFEGAPRILFADDAKDNRDLVRAMLTEAGAEVEVAADGGMALALHRSRRESYDAIVLDLEMPGSSGFEVAELLRREGYTGYLLALTARAMTRDRDRCLESGFDELIAKPFERRTLIQALSRRSIRSRPSAAAAATGSPRPSEAKDTSPRPAATTDPTWSPNRPRRGVWERFIRACMPAASRDDPTEMQRAGVVVGVALAPVPLVLLWGFAVPRLLHPDVGSRLGHMTILTAPLLCCLPFVLRSSGSILLTANALAAYAFAVLGTLGYFMGGAASTPLYWLILLPIATPALGVRSGLVWTVLALAQFAGFLALDRVHPVTNWTRPELLTVNAVLSFSTLNTLVTAIMLLYRKVHSDSIGRLAEANAALAEAQESNERASRSKSEFIAHVSHEMRTPMTSILGFSDLLAEELEQSGAAESLRREVEVIGRNGRQLLALVNGLLDLSGAESGRVQVECIEFDPVVLCREVVELLGIKARAKDLRLVFEPPDPPISGHVEGDPSRLRQVLINLVGNAIKFTHAGSVRVSVQARGDRLCFEVQDTGVGLAASEIESLFQPFRQASAGREGAEAGTGLGLSISRKLCELMGGELTVASQQGVGSCFKVELPAIADRGLATASAGAWDLDAATVARAQGRARVLLADDGPDNRVLLRALLEKLGLEVITAQDGRQALDAIESARDAGTGFDLILMDMQMPVLSGYEAVRLLRGQGYTGPIIAVTAQALDEERIRCLEAGCDAFATKPITRDVLSQVVRRWIASGK